MSSPAVAPASPAASGPAGRPSDDRRRALNEELSIPLVSNFFPIARYYEAADKVYDSFQQVLQDGNLDDAYVYGKRYCLFCMDAIPTHNYYDSPKFASNKKQSLSRVNSVIRQLESVVVLMDNEEREKERRRVEQERLREAQLAQERQQKLEKWQRSYDDRRERESSERKASSQDVQASALSKLERLNGRSLGSNSAAHQPPIRRDPSGEPPMAPPSSSSCRYRVLDDSEDEGAGGALPPPIPPPAASNGEMVPPPPSYEQVRSGRNFLGPAGHAATATYAQQQLAGLLVSGSALPLPKLPPKKVLRVPIRTLQDQYRSEYQRMLNAGQISVSYLSTYQGRLHESTNGCTVISALVAANHMMRPGMSSISNDEVAHIIDRVCGPVLRKIRSKLGLPAHALLIPSDVHDQLVDDNVLSQDVFEGASGGNVLDETHMGEFMKVLSAGESGKGENHSKAAATFFFREHVISIVKYLAPNGSQVCYDLIDSLPTSFQGGRSAATRTRCGSLDALRALLNWYCSRKFSDANCQYIDTQKWDDSMADFDPRVFQGFVWMSKQQ